MNEERYEEGLHERVREIERAEGGLDDVAPRGAADPAAAGLEGAGAAGTARLEAVVRWHRPVLWVREDQVQRRYSFDNPNGETSQRLIDRLAERHQEVASAIPAVGRIEVTNNSRFEWVGTGWIVDSDLGANVIVTNAHVAIEFARNAGTQFVFRAGTIQLDRPQAARIDFREEIGGAAPREFELVEVIWISDRPELDVALLRARPTSRDDRLAAPIPLLVSSAEAGRDVAVIGYPGDDSRSYDSAQYRRLFGDMPGTKRLAPGRVKEGGPTFVTHDCSTLPGNSGSVVLDLDTGSALGLHYSGAMFRANYAVSASQIARLLRARPWQGSERGARRPPVDRPIDGGRTSVLAGSPLEVTVQVRVAGHDVPVPGGASVDATRNDSHGAEIAASRLRREMAQDLSVLSVEGDYLFREGVISDDFGVVVRLAPGSSLDPADYGMGRLFDGFEVVLEEADPETIASEQLGLQLEAFSGRVARYERDLSERRFSLDPVEDDMKLTLHVSPEAGWPILSRFLGERRFEQLTIGMYHMTAPHVVEALKNVARRRRGRTTLTLDRQRGNLAVNPDDTGRGSKADDIPERDTLAELEALSAGFKWAPASIGSGGLFSTAYHIKAAVWTDRKRGNRLEDKIAWLSSGNWQSSNQPEIERELDEIESVPQRDVKGFNREWHALIEHPGLAAVLREHLEQDFEENLAAARLEAPMPSLPEVLVPDDELEMARPENFRAFPPKTIEGRVRVQPLLTPDNYPEVILSLLEGATRRILIENQSFNLWKQIDRTPEHFLKIAETVRAKQRAGLDVRIIFRSIFGGEREKIRRLKAFGIDTGSDHVRFFDTCHTKGLVIDDDVAVLGSHNWTAGGTGPNRDASLVIWHPDANAYFAELFEYDWANVARSRARQGRRESIRVVPAGAETPAPMGFRRVSLPEFLGEA